MRSGLVLRGGVVEVAPRLLLMVGQLLHVDRTEIRGMSIHSVHIEALAPIQRFIRSGRLGWSRVLEHTRRCRCCGAARVIRMNNGHVSPHSRLVLGL